MSYPAYGPASQFVTPEHRQIATLRIDGQTVVFSFLGYMSTVTSSSEFAVGYWQDTRTGLVYSSDDIEILSD